MESLGVGLEPLVYVLPHSLLQGLDFGNDR
jgi:hypothetical protein